MFGAYKDQTIKRKVMAVVNARIDTAQGEYDEESQRLDIALHEEIGRLHVKRENDGEALAERLVSKVLGNLA